MSTTNLSNQNIQKRSSPIFDECLSNKTNEDAARNNSEVYEKVRPLERMSQVFNKDQAHGDDTPIEILKEYNKPLELFSHDDQQISEKQTSIPPMSSSSNEFSLEMAMRVTDTSNEALKTDDENGMTKPYFVSRYDPKEHDIILSDVSLQQQRLPNHDCEYEIDLGNGWITKSISSYQSDNKQQRPSRPTAIISADSIQPMSTFKIPFTNTFYKQHLQVKQENPIDHYEESNTLFNSHDYVQPRWPQISLRTTAIFSVGTTILILIIALVLLIF